MLAHISKDGKIKLINKIESWNSLKFLIGKLNPLSKLNSSSLSEKLNLNSKRNNSKINCKDQKTSLIMLSQTFLDSKIRQI